MYKGQSSAAKKEVEEKFRKLKRERLCTGQQYKVNWVSFFFGGGGGGGGGIGEVDLDGLTGVCCVHLLTGLVCAVYTYWGLWGKGGGGRRGRSRH